MCFELIDTEPDESDKIVASTQKWNSYVDQLKNPAASDVLPGSSYGSGGGVGESSSRGNHSSNLEIKSEVSDADTVS